jgi:hypothetical protein
MRLHRTSLALFVVVTAVAVLTPGPGPHGDASALLALGLVSPATFGTALGTSGTVNSTAGSILVTTVLGSWTMRVSGSDGGHLRRTCAQGTQVLTNPLKVFATGSIISDFYGATSASPMSLTGSAQPVAGGSGLVTLHPVVLTYRYTPSASDQLAAACPYSETTTIELSSP